MRSSQKNLDSTIARQAKLLFGQTTSRSRAQVVPDSSGVLRLQGSPARGAKVFERECKTCHRVNDQGFALGPDLAGSPRRALTALMVNILDLNASVSLNFDQYLVIDQNRRTYSGLIAAKTAASLTLRQGERVEDTILRAQVDQLTSAGLSLMPEGFEKTILIAGMADLVAFLQIAHRGGDDDEAADTGRLQPLDIGTLPGLIEPDE
jgi:putative heme-binding domain-containing protein